MTIIIWSNAIYKIFLLFDSFLQKKLQVDIMGGRG